MVWYLFCAIACYQIAKWRNNDESRRIARKELN
jgi:hypothetical protein